MRGTGLDELTLICWRQHLPLALGRRRASVKSAPSSPSGKTLNYLITYR